MAMDLEDTANTKATLLRKVDLVVMVVMAVMAVDHPVGLTKPETVISPINSNSFLIIFIFSTYKF